MQHFRFESPFHVSLLSSIYSERQSLQYRYPAKYILTLDLSTASLIFHHHPSGTIWQQSLRTLFHNSIPTASHCTLTHHTVTVKYRTLISVNSRLTHWESWPFNIRPKNASTTRIPALYSLLLHRQHKIPYASILAQGHCRRSPPLPSAKPNKATIPFRCGEDTAQPTNGSATLQPTFH